jgi:hypothetical protein
MTDEEIVEKVRRLSVLLKMFDVNAHIEYRKDALKPFAIVGHLSNFAMGIHRETFEEIQVLADSYMRRDPSVLWEYEKKKKD